MRDVNKCVIDPCVQTYMHYFIDATNKKRDELKRVLSASLFHGT